MLSLFSVFSEFELVQQIPCTIPNWQFATLEFEQLSPPSIPVSAPDEDDLPRSLIPFRMSSQSELACVYAALILHDDGLEISVSAVVDVHNAC